MWVDVPNQAVCHQCGKVFNRPASQIARSRGLRHDFCSVECYDAYRIQPVWVTCAVCDKTFSVWKSRYERGAVKYCSNDCKREGLSIAAKEKHPPQVKACEICGKEFVLKPGKKGKSKRFCSNNCYGEWRARSGISAGENNPRYIDGSTIETMNRVRTRQWKLAANRVRKERGNVCENCGATGNGKLFPVHHIVPWRISHDDSPSNLQVLCPSCHAIADGLVRAQ